MPRKDIIYIYTVYTDSFPQDLVFMERIHSKTKHLPTGYSLHIKKKNWEMQSFSFAFTIYLQWHLWLWYLRWMSFVVNDEIIL